MENYSGQSATELDSHANMAVAGANVSIISKSGLVATVTPFSDDLPPMDNVEIGDVEIAYDDPRTGVTYILREIRLNLLTLLPGFFLCITQVFV